MYNTILTYSFSFTLSRPTPPMLRVCNSNSIMASSVISNITPLYPSSLRCSRLTDACMRVFSLHSTVMQWCIPTGHSHVIIGKYGMEFLSITTYYCTTMYGVKQGANDVGYSTEELLYLYTISPASA